MIKITCRIFLWLIVYKYNEGGSKEQSDSIHKGGVSMTQRHDIYNIAILS